MTEITFFTTKAKEYKIQCNLNDELKKACKKFAIEIGEKYKRLIFFSNGKRINKKMTVNEFQKDKSKKSDFILVKIMDISIESDSDEENTFIELKKNFIDEIKNPDINSSYEKMQELIVQYGYEEEKKIEEEIERKAENLIEPKEAIKLKNSNEKLFILGKLGESLQNKGIKVVIDKRDNLKNEDYIIKNQIIGSGFLNNIKYEVHIEIKDNNQRFLILNDENVQKKFIENWKSEISKFVDIPKKYIFITNLREGTITFDTIFSHIDLNELHKNELEINERMKEFANSDPRILSIFEKNILGACKLTLDMLDSRGDQFHGKWAERPAYRGGMEYFPPDKNWVGYGLKVLEQYDNKNNDWIGMDGNKNEWAVAYHGTSNNAVLPIIKKEGKFYSTIKEGAKRQFCKNYKNYNIKSQKLYKICGEGAYCSPHLEYAQKYSNSSNGVIIMCRVNPNLIRIPEGEYQENEWITDGTRNTIRPYRLLYNLNDKKE